MKRCSKCGLEKSLKEFYLRKTGPRANTYYEKCIDCYKTRGRDYYHNNRERQLPLAKARKQKYLQERREFLASFKNKPCVDCGKQYNSLVMDFDHKEGTIKIGNVSSLILRNVLNFDKIRDEIAKCDLVCANCHRERTHKRNQY